uniref:Uncharacterized protein n=1 Tax=Fervidobacterium nodosum TaxID=2424 RepID=A0A7C5U8U5_9BACT
MITINRKYAIIFSAIFLVVSIVLSGFYFYNSYYSYIRNLENLLSETTRVYNQMKRAEEESKFLEAKRQEFLNSPSIVKEGEFQERELQQLIETMLSNRFLEIDYLYLKAQVDYPILFEDTPVIYIVSLKTGGE